MDGLLPRTLLLLICRAYIIQSLLNTVEQTHTIPPRELPLLHSCFKPRELAFQFSLITATETQEQHASVLAVQPSA